MNGKGTLTCLLVFVAVTIANASPSLSQIQASEWETPQNLTNDLHIDANPSLSLSRDGKVWLAWSKYVWGEYNTEIYYKTNEQGQWSTDYRLTQHPAQDNSPGITVLRNGTAILAWSSNRRDNFNIYLTSLNGSNWTEPVDITADVDQRIGMRHDEVPEIVETEDALWLFWQRCQGTSCPGNGDRDIYYRRHKSLKWEDERALIAGPASDSLVSATTAKDGTMWITWSHNDDIYYKTYKDGMWSPDQQLTNSIDPDLSPSTLIARDGSVWTSWNRPLGTATLQNDIFYKRFDPTTGLWSAETRLTDTPTDELQTSLIHGPDKRIWMVYRSNDNLEETWDLFLTRSLGPVLFHDIALGAVETHPANVRRGQGVNVSIESLNLGDWEETLAITLYATNSLDVDTDGDIDLQDLLQVQLAQYTYDPVCDVDQDGDVDLDDSVTVYLSLFTNPTVLVETRNLSLAPGQKTQVYFQWTTDNVDFRTYRFLARAAPVQSEPETNTVDNQASGGSLNIYRPEDLNMDGHVTLDDLMLVYISRYTSDPFFDVDMDGDVDLQDLVLVYLAQYT